MSASDNNKQEQIGGGRMVRGTRPNNTPPFKIQSSLPSHSTSVPGPALCDLMRVSLWAVTKTGRAHFHKHRHTRRLHSATVSLAAAAQVYVGRVLFALRLRNSLAAG
jgi:hypothetical protein